MNSPMHPGLRKAAIFVASLEPSAADSVLEQMEPDQAQQIRQAVMELRELDPTEQEEVIAEFRRKRTGAPVASGVEVAGELARRFAPAAAEQPKAKPPARSPHDSRFGFLCEAEADQLARILAAERPQTIAVVLAHVPPDQASRLLMHLDPALQVDVVRRLVDLEETDPEILREVEQGLQARLAASVPMHRRRVAGLDAVAEIIAASGQAGVNPLLENLFRYDRPLAEKLQPERVEFADLVQSDDRTLRMTLQEADPEWIMVALIGAPPAWVDRFLGLLPDELARRVRSELSSPGPIRLSDVDEARRRLAELAHQLALQGRIGWPHRARSHHAA